MISKSFSNALFTWYFYDHSQHFSWSPANDKATWHLNASLCASPSGLWTMEPCCSCLASARSCTRQWRIPVISYTTTSHKVDCQLWTQDLQNSAYAQGLHQAFCKEFYAMVLCKIWLNLLLPFNWDMLKNSFIVHDSTFSCRINTVVGKWSPHVVLNVWATATFHQMFCCHSLHACHEPYACTIDP